jgi:hypothetical protein
MSAGKVSETFGELLKTEHHATVAAIAQVQLLQPQLTGVGEGTQTMQIDTQKALDHRLPPSARRW